MTIEADAATPGAPRAAELRDNLSNTVAQVVSQGQHVIAVVEIEIARIEHQVVTARKKLETLRQTFDAIQAIGERIGGRSGG